MVFYIARYRIFRLARTIADLVGTDCYSMRLTEH
jgi:hypothetical protein